MEYRVVISLDTESGFWCGHKEYSDGSAGPKYAFSPSSSCVEYKLVEDGEELENFVYAEE